MFILPIALFMDVPFRFAFILKLMLLPGNLLYSFMAFIFSRSTSAMMFAVERFCFLLNSPFIEIFPLGSLIPIIPLNAMLAFVLFKLPFTMMLW